MNKLVSCLDQCTLTAPNDFLRDKLLDFVTHNGYAIGPQLYYTEKHTRHDVIAQEPFTLYDMHLASPVGSSDHCQVYSDVASTVKCNEQV
jgi:hypothetical protein